MNVRKFVASTARDALRKVKELLGPDAIILSNRAIPGGVEIMAVAASDMEMIVPTSAPAPAPKTRLDDDYTVRLSSQGTSPPPVPRRPPVAEPPPLASRPMPRMDSLPPQETAAAAPRQAEIVPAEVMDEIRSLRKIVEQHLAGFAWGEAARSEPVKTEMLRQMLDAGFSPRLARDLLSELPRELNALQALAWLKSAADRSLLTIGNDSDIIDRGGCVCAGRSHRCWQDDDYGQTGCALRVASWSQQGCIDHYRRIPDWRARAITHLRADTRRFRVLGERRARAESDSRRSATQTHGACGYHGHEPA